MLNGAAVERLIAVKARSGQWQRRVNKPAPLMPAVIGEGEAEEDEA